MKHLEFTDGARTFTCSAEAAASTPGTVWWWVNVTGESSRYAAFRAEAGDTAKTLRPRILAYYENLLVGRARPVMSRWDWAQRRRAEAAAKAEGGAANPS
jgi:hypothetical protein